MLCRSGGGPAAGLAAPPPACHGRDLALPLCVLRGFAFKSGQAWTFSCSNHQRLTLGSVYAIVALGYTMVYGIIQLINFAHGELVMIGAMVAFS